MKKRLVFITVIFVFILTITFCGTEVSKKEEQSKSPKHPSLSITLKWKIKDNTVGEKKVVDTLKLSESGMDVYYLLFRKNIRLEPLFCFNSEAIPLDIDLEKTSSLVLLVEWVQDGKTLKMERLLFAADRIMGTRTPMEKNIYCLSVLKDLAPLKQKNLPARLPQKFQNAANRILTMNTLYASESDEYAEKISDTFQVKTKYATPRFILSSEEWMTVPVVKKKKKSSGGLFGFDLESKMSGKSEKKTTNIPIYSLDVLQDRIEADGEFPVAFQTARSIYNDTLESQIIYQLTEGKRRILSTSVVFNQMMKNKKLRGMENEIITVDFSNPSASENCTALWPSAKERILSFAQSHPEWKIIVPKYPVVFFQGDEPLYGMYAWFQVEPKTGRMKGILPTGLHGATEEVGIIQKVLEKEAKRRVKGVVKKIVHTEGGIHTYFGVLAGLYVSSGGILEGVTITMVNPDVASMSGEDWKKFLASHAIKYSRDFLTANKDLYDSYSVRAGFWGGVAAIVSHFNGKEAASECLENAWKDIEKKIINDIKSWGAKQVHAEGGEAGLDTAEEIYKRLKGKEKKAGRLFNRVNGQYGTGQSSYGNNSKIKSHLKNASDGK